MTVLLGRFQSGFSHVAFSLRCESTNRFTTRVLFVLLYRCSWVLIILHFQSTLDSLHQEIELYYQTLSSLLSSMNAYNGTPAYRKEAVVIAAVDRAALCKNLLNDVLADLRPMKIQLSRSASPNAEPRPATTASPLTRLSQFCRESNHVMQTLVPVLQKWHDKCRECASTGRRWKRSINCRTS